MGKFVSSCVAALFLGASPVLAQEPATPPAEMQLSTNTVISEIDIRHLRAIAETFGLETVQEQVNPGQVLLAARIPGEPVFNLLATTCDSPDQIGECQVLIVRSLYDPEDKPFTQAMVHALNVRFAVSKAILLDDGRMQLDRLMILTGGTTFGNIADNVSAAYQTFKPAEEIIYPQAD